MPPAGFETTISAGERPQIYALDRAATGTGMGFLVVPNKLILIVINRSSAWSYFAFFASCYNQPPVYRTKSKLDQLFKKFPAFAPHHNIARVFLWSVCWSTPVSFRTVFRKCWHFRVSLGLSNGLVVLFRHFLWICFFLYCTYCRTVGLAVDLQLIPTT
jgi:hypothetical protein